MQRRGGVVAVQHRLNFVGLDFWREQSVVAGMKRRAKSVRSADSQNQIEIVSKIEEINSLTLEALRVLWRAEFRCEPPKGLSRDLLVRTLAWRLQEKDFGGHDKATRALLDAYAGGKAAAMHRRLKAGTVLVREYQNTRHTVTIMPDGYLWQDKTYPNLTLIARAITGTNWNGPRFFGLRQGPRKTNEQKATSL
jgi:hypothetical protein